MYSYSRHLPRRGLRPFRDHALDSVVGKWRSLFPGLGFGAAYKITRPRASPTTLHTWRLVPLRVRLSCVCGCVWLCTPRGGWPSENLAPTCTPYVVAPPPDPLLVGPTCLAEPVPPSACLKRPGPSIFTVKWPKYTTRESLAPFSAVWPNLPHPVWLLLARAHDTRGGRWHRLFTSRKAQLPEPATCFSLCPS